MKITKLVHSCILVEEKNIRILIDPGNYSTLQNEANNIDVILISHAHKDHCDVNSIRIILRNNPKARIFTNSEVGVILEEEGISAEVLENGQIIIEKDVTIEAFEEDHIVVYNGLPSMKNLSFLINNKLLFTGDKLVETDKKIEALAFPMAGPIFSQTSVLDYIIKINPKVCFPVHDAMLNEKAKTYYEFSEKILSPLGIKFIKLDIGKELEF